MQKNAIDRLCYLRIYVYLHVNYLLKIVETTNIYPQKNVL